MRPRRFLLKPFPGERFPAGLTIGGSIGRHAEILSVLCSVRGDLSTVSIPVAADAPRRKDRLWEETCLELFLGMEDSGEYWEINLSPSGDWNVFRFASYREGMREEPAVTILPLEIRREPKAITLAAEIDVGTIIPADKGLAASVAAVIVTTDGAESHWAPAHPSSRPDFHRRDGFALILPAERPSL